MYNEIMQNFTTKKICIFTLLISIVFITFLGNTLEVSAADVTVNVTPSDISTTQDVIITYTASSAVELPGTLYSVFIFPGLPSSISNCTTPDTDIDPGSGGTGSFISFSNDSAVFNLDTATSTTTRSLCVRLPSASQGSYTLTISTSSNDFGATTLGVGGVSQVDITAQVYSCELNIIIYPEKRIPQINNWDTLLDIQIFSNQTQVASFLVPSNNFGVANFPLCLNNYQLTSGNYNFYVRGFSHLRRRYINVTAFDTQTETLDLRPFGEMFAGETSVVFDNYINVLDVSTQISNMYTSSIKNDLNQDGYVNTLDISNTITNFYLNGQ